MNDLTADFADFVQADRTIRIETPLGPDILLPERAELTEGVNALFEFRVVVRSKNLQIQAAEIVGHLADVSLDLDGTGARRTWNGLVVEMHEQPNVMRGFRRYVLTLRPSLWLMSQKSDCRIWQDLTTVDVLHTLMSEHGLPAPQVSLLQPVPSQHYSVQWNETDLDYLRRRMEEDGLFFWHAHEPGQHTLNVADSAVAWRDAEPADLRLTLGSSDRNNITSWSKRYLYTPGVRAGADWNFQTPTTVPGGKTNSLVELPRNGAYELYEYPARIATPDEADRATKLRMQATEVDHERIEGASLIRTLAPGQRFKPYDLSSPEPAYEKHALLEVVHTLVDRTYEPDETAPDYANSFVALPSRLSATPHRATHRPRLDGTQTAIIAGPAGEEIYTDEFGRVKLWFPWDRRAKKDGSDTCWVRVIQSWAGGNWGGQIIPRVDMEAMVAYQDGDPDRPVVVGLVPNPVNEAPYLLPTKKTRMVFRSKTYQGRGNNEMSMEDATDNEEYYMHAQKDMNTKVLNNWSRRVDVNAVESVGLNKGVEVENNRRDVTGGDYAISVGPSYKGQIVSQEASTLPTGVGRTAYAMGALPTAAKGTGNLSITVEQNMQETILRSHVERVSKVKETHVGTDFLIEVENDMTIKAGDRIILHAGDSQIVLEKDGTISLTGQRILINGQQQVIVASDIVKIN